MTRLHELGPAKGSRKDNRRRGRGPGSGLGKTAGRGHKGQRARSGGGVRPGFEGGQMPLQRRIPYGRGFKNPFRREFTVVNLESLNRFDAGTEVTPELLLASGIISRVGGGVKILARGEIDRALTVTAHSFSQSAVQKIESAGGRVEVIQS